MRRQSRGAICLIALIVAITRVRANEDASPAAPHEREPEYTEAERGHWSFRPVQEATPPPLSSAEDRRWVRTPVDAFILQELKRHALGPSRRADRRTLIRRVTFDLTGLPPTPEEIAAFLGEPSFDLAWARLMDRLLASPQYGVRWGQHWLDVIRFAESEGFEYDRHLPGAWMFRDYVVHAFNSDKPYDAFIREQLAGDEMVPPAEVLTAVEQSLSNPQYERRVAAGFHRFGPVRRNAGNALVAFSRNEVLTERTNIIGTAFLGLSLGCARCHDHMFDPIRQSDYYRMQAFLASTYAADVPITDQQTWQQWKGATDTVNGEIAQVKDALSQAADEEEVRLKNKLKELQSKLPHPLPTLFSVQEQPDERTDIHLLQRGDEFKPGARVSMRVLGVLLPESTPELPAETEHPKSKLAEWIVDPHNPLTARVIVNRVWQKHFGTGLVSTANDFGLNGSPPSHPELLDWLAGEFIRGGWSIKALHRLILDSSCYLQSSDSDVPAQTMEVDPDNRLLWRYQRRRLSAEELRDAMLSISGRMNPQLGGPSVMLPVDPDLVALLYEPDQWQVTENAAQHDRRSIYLMAKRNLRLPFLEVFDQPDLQTSCDCREQSTHAPQALEMLNGRLANNLAASLAERLQSECGADRALLADRAFELTTGRLPSERQRALAAAFLEEQPLGEFALAVFNLNAFLYVD